MDRSRVACLIGVAALMALLLMVFYHPILSEARRGSATSPQYGAGPGKPISVLDARVAVPNVEFAGAGGETITLKRFSGRIVVLSLWATWCAPCIKEMPSLDRLAAKVPGVAVVTVNVDAKGLEGATGFMSKHSLTNLAPYYDSTGKMMGMLEGRGLPTSFIIDRDGKIAAVVSGAVDWTSDTMLNLLMRI